MPDGPHRIDWEWEEIVLACDLVAQNAWRQLDANDPRVRELSDMWQRMSMHPLEDRLPSFRNAAGVARKTYNIATVHPDYVGPPSNGNKLDKEVLDDFIDDPERMYGYAQSLRRAAERDELGTSRSLSAMSTKVFLRADTCCACTEYGSGSPRCARRRSAASRRAVRRSRAKRAALTSGEPTVIGAWASSNATTWSHCIKPANAPRPSAILLCFAATVIA